MKWRIVVALTLASGCTSDPAQQDSEREVSAEVGVDTKGWSEPFEFEVPVQTRSIAIVVRGNPGELFALGELVLSDGVDRVALDGAHGYADALSSEYYDEETGTVPGQLYQTSRLGTFAHVYPYAPGPPVPAGSARLRVISTAVSGSVEISVVMKEDNGASMLAVNLIAVSESYSLAPQPAFVESFADIFATAGIDVRVDEALEVRDSALRDIVDFSEPQEAPENDSVQLTELGRELVDNDSLNIYLVDSLPFGVAGLSLGVPGPPMADSYYYGVVVRHDAQGLGRVVAHEVAHFLGLQHVENRSVSGKLHPDPIDDTQPNTGNLMDSGSEISPGQAAVLQRSPLLQVPPTI
jgi:hypothetical protein